jgi:hypothetical protein
MLPSAFYWSHVEHILTLWHSIGQACSGLRDASLGIHEEELTNNILTAVQVSPSHE